ncbi:hypothetical protein BB8028_0003g09400 [Beauveria bassiana]|uniref:BZIP domain-containing protein n=2 Tax=Beauveria bassiana TaxID=176275 RepID=A0A0A2VXJ4_BEABA|nr:hypothetical protein BBAD15_g1861 [Beauveria bassiana D1-5]PQK12323.1 hypothetical protein BB8028_0003g09400 [Beauveria bassiana]
MAAKNMSIDSKPTPRHESEDSAASTPEGEPNPVTPVATVPAQPKRKGGRKPLYATSEERKQRNRQAQAAFRERRTEYIKQLEAAIAVHEGNLDSLQTAHRNAADECLMLRYKNSLLERILLEKGIDVNAELQAKNGSPILGPTHMPQNMAQPAQFHRPVMNRVRKSVSSLAPKVEASNTAMAGVKTETSPQTRPMHSPINAGSAFASTMENVPGGRSQMPAILTEMSGQPLMDRRSGSVSSGGNLYATSTFHGHLDQLEHEYDHNGDMMQDSELDNGTHNEPFPHTFDGGDNMMVSATSATAASATASHQVPASGPGFSSMSQLLEQNLDWDPFGLSASMNFPPQQIPFEHPGTLR